MVLRYELPIVISPLHWITESRYNSETNIEEIAKQKVRLVFGNAVDSMRETSVHKYTLPSSHSCSQLAISGKRW